METEQELGMIRSELSMLESRMFDLEVVSQNLRSEDAVRISHVVPGAGIDVKQMGEEVVISASAAEDPSNLSFYQVLAGASYIINAGSIICGNTILDVATTTLTLTGSVAYVYAYAKMDLSSAGVNFMALDPLTVPFDGTEYRWRLAKLEAVSAGHYTRTRHYWYGGDLTAYAPLGK